MYLKSRLTFLVIALNIQTTLLQNYYLHLPPLKKVLTKFTSRFPEGVHLQLTP